MEKKKQGVSLGVVILLALVSLFMGIVAYMYFKDLSANKLVTGFELNLKSITEKKQEVINNDKGSLETFLDKIFLGNGIVKEALPEFNNINDADKDWINSVVYYDLLSQESENKIFSYDDIQKKLNDFIGNNINIQFPKEGTDKIIKLENEENKYQLKDLEINNDLFYGYTILNIGALDGNYIITINEFKYQISEDRETYIFMDKTGKAIKTYPSSYDTEEEWNNNIKEMKDFATKNSDRFTKEEITIGKEKDTENMYIVSVKVK